VASRPKFWPRPQRFDLVVGLGLEDLASASALASNIWPRPGLDLVVLLCNRAFFGQKSCKIREFCYFFPAIILNRMLLIIIWYFLHNCFWLPRPWPQPPEIGLGLGLVALASASTSASRFWPHLASLHKGNLRENLVFGGFSGLSTRRCSNFYPRDAMLARVILFCMYSTIACVTNLLNLFGPTLTPILYCLSINAQLYKIPQFHFLTSCKP